MNSYSKQSLFWLVMLIVSSIVFFAIGYATTNDDMQSKLDILVEQVDSVVAYSGTLKKQAELYQNEIVKLNDENEKIKQTSAILNNKFLKEKKTADSLKIVVDTLTNIPIPAQEYITSLETQMEFLVEDISFKTQIIANLERQAILLTTQRDLHQSRADSLESIIVKIPTTINDSDKILGFIPKPTRTQSFIAGGVSATLIIMFAK